MLDGVTQQDKRRGHVAWSVVAPLLDACGTVPQTVARFVTAPFPHVFG
jgi:hypothetical protein